MADVWDDLQYYNSTLIMREVRNQNTAQIQLFQIQLLKKYQ